MPNSPCNTCHMSNPVPSLLRAFTDFRVDAFSVSSYSDEGQDPRFGGSLLAHGRVDNIRLDLPPPPVSALRGFFSNDAWTVSFGSRTNWIYALEATGDFQFWREVSPAATGTGGDIILRTEAASQSVAAQYYRIKAWRLP